MKKKYNNDKKITKSRMKKKYKNDKNIKKY